MYGEERTVEENINAAVESLEAAAVGSPDLICLPELFPHVGIPIEEALPVAEPIPGPLTERLGGIAERHGAWIAGGTFSRDDAGSRNSLFLLDDRGELFGVYHKMFPTLGELEAGIVPGDRVGVFETPWGRVGGAICFDMNFDETMNGLGKQGASLVLFPSFYHAGIHNAVRAVQNQFYLASAQVMGEGQPGGFIVDPLGRRLIEGNNDRPAIHADIGLDFVVAHLNWNEEQIETLAGDIGGGVSVETMANEEHALITSYVPDRSAEELAAGYGIELKSDYLARARKQRRAAQRNGRS